MKIIKFLSNQLSHFREVQRRGNDLTHTLPTKRETVTCINCGTEYTGLYCPECGQPASTKRITLKDTLHNIIVAIFAGDEVFFHTCRDLLWRPGYMVADYIYGHRSPYFRPIHMLVRIVAIYVLVSLVLGKGNEILTIVDESTLQENVHSALMADVIRLMSAVFTNKIYSALIMVIFCVLPFRWTFCKCKLRRFDGTLLTLNTAEHFYALVYLACLKMIVSLILLCCNSVGITIFNDELLLLLFYIFIPIWLYRQIYEISWLRATLLGFGAITLTLILIAITIMLSFGIFYGIDAVR